MGDIFLPKIPKLFEAFERLAIARGENVPKILGIFLKIHFRKQIHFKRILNSTKSVCKESINKVRGKSTKGTFTRMKLFGVNEI